MASPTQGAIDPNLVQGEILEQPERAPFDPVSEVRTLILGPRSSGKTSVLYKLCAEEFMDAGEPQPTTGYNVASLVREGEEGIFHFWDLSGADNFHANWKYFFTDVRAVIYVIDSTDPEKFELMRQEIIALHNDEELAKASFLFISNKIDISSSWPKDDIVKQLGLKKLNRRAWKILEAVAFSGHGLEEALGWLWVDVNTHPDDKTYIEEDPEPEVLPFGEEGNAEGGELNAGGEGQENGQAEDGQAQKNVEEEGVDLFE